MKIKKIVLIFIAMNFIISCSNEERDKVLGVNPGNVDLSAAQLESCFQVFGDYDIHSFMIDGEEECKITTDIKKNNITVINVSDEYEAKIHCKEFRITKIDLQFMTIEKLKKGQYKVKLHISSGSKIPIAVSFSFVGSNGISTVSITFK